MISPVPERMPIVANQLGHKAWLDWFRELQRAGGSVAALKSRIATLEGHIASLQARVAALEVPPEE